MKYVVTFHRTYEVDDSVIHEKLQDEGYNDVEMNESLMKEKAEEMAREYFEEESEMFFETSNDFVSATVEIIND